MNYREIINKRINDSNILDTIEDRVAYSSDASLLESLPSVVIIVENQTDFDNAIKVCTENNLKFLIRGKATGYTGGCVPLDDTVVISVENWKGIIEFDEIKETAIFAPGTTIGEINEFAEKYNLFFPPDPISKNHCSLGGAISENSSGPRCLRFGPLHCFVEEFQFYSVNGLEHIVKKGCNDDISDFFYSIVGSEGTLGAVGWIKIRLVKKPKEVLLFSMEFNTSKIINTLLERCFVSGIPFSAMEMITPSYHTNIGRVGQYYLLLEYFSYSDRDKVEFYKKLNEYTRGLPVKVSMPTGVIYDVRGKAYQINRRLINDLIQKRPISLLVDGVVPRTSLENLVEEIYKISEENKIPMLDTFHFSDGNIHPTFFVENNSNGMKEKNKILELVMEKCVELGGSLAAEHGIGLEKVEYIAKKHSSYELERFYQIKDLFDPAHLLNCGKILPPNMPNSKAVNLKFDTKEKIEIDKINMTVVVDADVTLFQLEKKCKEVGLNIGYLTFGVDENVTIIDEIRKQNTNLLVKRHGELIDSILGIMFEEDGKIKIYGDRLVKNVSGYNIWRSIQVLEKNVKKICLRVFNDTGNKYYVLKTVHISDELLLKINAVSFDFTPVVFFKGEKEFEVIFASSYDEKELKVKGIDDVVRINGEIIKRFQIYNRKKIEGWQYECMKPMTMYNYQKGEIYECGN